MSKPFGFTPSKPFGFSDENKMRIPIPEEEFKDYKDNPSQKNLAADKLDLQAQIHLSTQKIDPKSLSPLHIYLSVSGMVESGECGSEEFLQLKYDLLSGRDWKLLAVLLPFFMFFITFFKLGKNFRGFTIRKSFPSQ